MNAVVSSVMPKGVEHKLRSYPEGLQEMVWFHL